MCACRYTYVCEIDIKGHTHESMKSRAKKSSFYVSEVGGHTRIDTLGYVCTCVCVHVPPTVHSQSLSDHTKHTKKCFLAERELDGGGLRISPGRGLSEL